MTKKRQRGFSRSSNIIKKGHSEFEIRDIYHLLMILEWEKFILLILVFYLIANVMFALLYLLGGDCIQNARTGSFSDAFFFSVQTMATIGYGGMYPKTDYAHIIVTIEALFGIVEVAILTGLAFGRFSVPTAKVLFSKVAVVTTYNQIPTLMFRATNERNNLIVEAQVRATLIINEISEEGELMRRLYDLELVRNQTPLLALSWMIMHPINPDSPLYGLTTEKLIAQEGEILITLTGIDETVSQTIHTHHSFLADEILWDHKFVDIFSRCSDGKVIIDYTNFHNVV
jgi:inward rectifier potassium channel